ncbi:MAG TPA: hypothetical protein VNU01_08050 [Egibacteraceae bacterium]|nr:hypothetical protein [Egibacteraceae bacterium]
MTVAQEEAASKDDIKRLDNRIDRLSDRVERGFASVHEKLDKLNVTHLRSTLALAALIVAVNRWG